jgi:inner membrane protein
MDNLTHIVLSGGIAACIAPADRRRAALIAGAVLGTLPDLDIFWPQPDALAAVTSHRGATHSLLVLPAAGLLLWLLAYWRSAAVRTAPVRWLLAVLAALLAHPLLDACTVYGTQLFWPLDRPSVMGALLFIIDPAFTLPLVFGYIAAWRLRERPRAGLYLSMGLALSAVYLAWAFIAKSHIEAGMRADLAQRGIAEAKLLTTPTPFNTLLWRVLVVRPDGAYYEGYYSFLAHQPDLILDEFPSQRALLEPLHEEPAVQRLRWFTHDFYAVDEVAGKLVMTDLRMGAEPRYAFRFAVASNQGGVPKPIAVEQLPWPDYSMDDLRKLWRLMWHPVTRPLAPAASSASP